MGQALLNGLPKSDYYVEIVEKKLIDGYHTHLTPATVEGDFAFIIFAIKPQKAVEIVPLYARFAQPDSVFISIMAGVTTTKLQQWLGQQARCVRVMPNTPAAIGQGVSVAVGAVTSLQKDSLEKIFRACGLFCWVEDEAQMDAVTALSGSGPAYVFALCEAMAAAGVAAGLSPDLAMMLARQTLIGSAALLAHQPHDTPTVLRQAVTSPQGTTAAGLEVLLAADTGLFPLLQQVVAAAAARSAALSRL